MNIKVNDKVQVMSGKDKGKSGKVLQVLPGMNKVVVEGINVMYKHVRSRKQDEKGQRIQFNGPVPYGNLSLVCPKCGKPTRVGATHTKDEKSGKSKKHRVCKKCKANID